MRSGASMVGAVMFLSSFCQLVRSLPAAVGGTRRADVGRPVDAPPRGGRVGSAPAGLSGGVLGFGDAELFGFLARETLLYLAVVLEPVPRDVDAFPAGSGGGHQAPPIA